eukprot:scaffold8355_cov59-Phaeocystis_antarctica.AAC.2
MPSASLAARFAECPRPVGGPRPLNYGQKARSLWAKLPVSKVAQSLSSIYTRKWRTTMASIATTRVSTGSPPAGPPRN